MCGYSDDRHFQFITERLRYDQMISILQCISDLGEHTYDKKLYMKISVDFEKDFMEYQ